MVALKSPQIIDNASKKATTEAGKLNLKRLHGKLHRASARQVQEFIYQNWDAIAAYHAKGKEDSFGDKMDALSEDINNATWSNFKTIWARYKAHNKLARVALRFVRKSNASFEKLNTENIKFTRITAEKIQQRMDIRLALKREAKKYMHHALRGALSGLLGLAKTIVSPLRVSKNSIFGALAFMGSEKPKTLVASFLAAAIGIQSMPVNAAPYAYLFLPKDLSQNMFHTACQDPRVSNGDKLTAALATSIDMNDANKRTMFSSSLESQDAGMATIAAFMITAKETNGGRDLTAPTSSAKGLWQSIDGTTLEWIVKYAAKTSFYKNTKERLSNAATYEGRASDMAFMQAIDTTIKNFSPKMLANVKKGVVPSYVFQAMNASYSTVFGGQLFGQVLKNQAPYLSAANLENKSLSEVVKLVSQYYQENHLLGHAGGHFLSYLVKHYPNTKMNDKKTLEKIYASFPNKDKDFTNVGTYYIAASKQNGILNSDATALEFSQQITKFVKNWAKKTTPGIEAQLKIGNSAAEICAKNTAAISAMVPKTTNGFEIGLRQWGRILNIDSARLVNTWRGIATPIDTTKAALKQKTTIIPVGKEAPNMPIPIPRPKSA